MSTSIVPEEMAAWVNRVMAEIRKEVVGQNRLIERLFIALLCNQHLLIEGVPGVAKTLTVNALAKALSLQFSRIQFTPDLLPSDLVGTLIYDPKSSSFTPKKGPVFANLILADEINRAPAKVQSALLECMQERQVTLGDHTFLLDRPFMVLATQNPIEQEGTYPLPEAQVDRFMMKVKVDYPTAEEALDILNRHSSVEPLPDLQPVATQQEIRHFSSWVDLVFMEETIKRYIVRLVEATRDPKNPYIQFGASPRAVIALTQAAKAYALLHGRDWTGAEDVTEVAKEVLGHRLILTYEALAEGKTADMLLDELIRRVKL